MRDRHAADVLQRLTEVGDLLILEHLLRDRLNVERRFHDRRFGLGADADVPQDVGRVERVLRRPRAAIAAGRQGSSPGRAPSLVVRAADGAPTSIVGSCSCARTEAWTTPKAKAANETLDSRSRNFMIASKIFHPCTARHRSRPAKEGGRRFRPIDFGDGLSRRASVTALDRQETMGGARAGEDVGPIGCYPRRGVKWAPRHSQGRPGEGEKNLRRRRDGAFKWRCVSA